MEAKSITIELIQESLLNADIPAALEYMMLATRDLINNEEIANKLISLKNRFASNLEQHHAGTLKYEDFSTEHHKIVESIIALKDKMKQELSEAMTSSKLQDTELELLIYANAYAYTIKDIELVAKTLHSRIKEQTIETTSQAFENNTLALIYEVKSIEIVELGEAFATANVVQITRDRNPSFFRNNEVKMSHTFLKEEEKWKFYTSITQEIKYF